MKKAGSRNSRLTVTLSILVNKYIFVIFSYILVSVYCGIGFSSELFCWIPINYWDLDRLFVCTENCQPKGEIYW